MSYQFKRAIANGTVFEYDPDKSNSACRIHAAGVMGIDPVNVVIERHDHRPSSLCNPCNDEADLAHDRLEELRTELRAGTMSYGELADLQGLAEFIEPGDVELLEAAGVPEFPEDDANSVADEVSILIDMVRDERLTKDEVIGRLANILTMIGEDSLDTTCTSDDPTNHQGDTCPIHEDEA